METIKIIHSTENVTRSFGPIETVAVALCYQHFIHGPNKTCVRITTMNNISCPTKDCTDVYDDGTF
jgi:hypothetical protein